jgi:hypothetical protein
MGKRHVANLAALIGCDLFTYPLSDLAVACIVACQTDHTNRRRHPRSGLPLSASIITAFLVLLSVRAEKIAQESATPFFPFWVNLIEPASPALLVSWHRAAKSRRTPLIAR